MLNYIFTAPASVFHEAGEPFLLLGSITNGVCSVRLVSSLGVTRRMLQLIRFLLPPLYRLQVVTTPSFAWLLLPCDCT